MARVITCLCVPGLSSFSSTGKNAKRKTSELEDTLTESVERKTGERNWGKGQQAESCEAPLVVEDSKTKQTKPKNT